MSIATAQWKEHDAREEIPSHVSQVNSTQPGFGFDRDNVLKAGLVIAGISDVGFRAETFNRENMQKLEEAWDTISARLYLELNLHHSVLPGTPSMLRRFYSSGLRSPSA